MNTRLPTLSAAAEKLSIGPRKLIAELKRRKIIDGHNFATLEYRNRGYFKIEQRSYHLDNRGVDRNYYVTTVTDEGLFFLQEIANELRGANGIHAGHGADRATAEREVGPVSGSDRSGAVCGVQP